MDDQDLRTRAHETEVTVWVGKAGLAAVVDELAAQLADRELVKVKFLRAARSEGSVEELAGELANSTDADLIETRGHTAVFHR